ncbi:MAG: iron-containing alcohol dehydrogenase [Bacillota bacterium]|nr:iron-containing alcohol dehydrogenase [Bacillota bacterium]
MLGNFKYCNPTKLFFGEDALRYLNRELPNYGDTVMLVYGGGSIKRTGVYDEVLEVLEANGKKIVEDPGVMPNPTVQKLREGAKLARENEVDLILAVGGGSVCDYSKAVSVSAYIDEDPWDKYYARFRNVDRDTKIIPVGCILTMVGTGSEMNGGAVITNPEQKLKIGHVFDERVYPKFAVLNPKYTFTVPRRQMVSGIYDIFNHICEQYFSGEDDNTSDYISEGMMKSLINSSRIALKNPEDYEARSNIMWTATWALNTFVGRGKSEDWMVHMIGQAIGAYTDATHGMTLSAVSMAYYRQICESGLQKFKRFAINVWNVKEEGKTDLEIAGEGLDAMKAWMEELGLVMNIRDLGVTEDMFDGIVESTILLNGGYKKLDKEDVRKVLEDSFC